MRTIVSRLRRKLGDDADNPAYILPNLASATDVGGKAGGDRLATPQQPMGLGSGLNLQRQTEWCGPKLTVGRTIFELWMGL